MCGRFSLAVNGETLAEVFDLAEVPEVAPRYNVAPTTPVLVVRTDASGLRRAAAMRWGMAPPRAERLGGSKPIINARAETVASRGMFRWPLRHRRCIVPADGFYEWRKVGSDRQPFRFCRPDGLPFAMAGLFSEWSSPEGEVLETCAVVTTTPNALLRPVHDRMPAILTGDAVATWLSPVSEPVERLLSLLGPAPDELLVAYPVSRRVGSPSHDDPACIEPVRSLSLASPATKHAEDRLGPVQTLLDLSLQSRVD